MKKLIESPMYRNDNYLPTESGEINVREFVMNKRTIRDNKPVHAGVCILQHSKLMLLQFVGFLRKYLINGSYSLIYGGKPIKFDKIIYLRIKFLDTDSLTIATTRTGIIETDSRKEQMEKFFLPIVKDNLKDEFETKWVKWLVLSNTIEEERCPGKLKVEFMTQNGEMISLSPKSYYAYCRTNDLVKDGKKGVPMWFTLKLEQYKDALYNDSLKTSIVEVRSLRLNLQKQMTRTTTYKQGLSSIHVKMAVDENKISGSPLKVNNQYI
jgi:hypothetical protein